MAKKMTSDTFRYKNIKIDTLYPSCTIAALYIKRYLPLCRKVWLFGSESMKEELESFGLEVVGGTKGAPNFDNPDHVITPEYIDDYYQKEMENNVDAVV